MNKTLELLPFHPPQWYDRGMKANIWFNKTYSFAEARFWASEGQLHPDWGDPSPSIHFRHAGRANIGWVDGHIDMKKLVPYESENIVYGDIDFLKMTLGWFEPLDNSLFDLK